MDRVDAVEQLATRRFDVLVVGGGIVGAGIAEAASGTHEALPFHGTHQQGIATPQQPALFLAAFDLETSSVAELRALMRRWSAAAARMTQGLRVAPDLPSGGIPPQDSGDVDGMLAGRLTVTFGFGARVFTLPGLARRRPAAASGLRSCRPSP